MTVQPKEKSPIAKRTIFLGQRKSSVTHGTTLAIPASAVRTKAIPRVILARFSIVDHGVAI
jgi:hypothetical protein